MIMIIYRYRWKSIQFELIASFSVQMSYAYRYLTLSKKGLKHFLFIRIRFRLRIPPSHDSIKDLEYMSDWYIGIYIYQYIYISQVNLVLMEKSTKQVGLTLKQFNAFFIFFFIKIWILPTSYINQTDCSIMSLLHIYHNGRLRS